MADGGDHDYTLTDNATKDESEEVDQVEESETNLGGGIFQIRAGKKSC